MDALFDLGFSEVLRRAEKLILVFEGVDGIFVTGGKGSPANPSLAKSISSITAAQRDILSRKSCLFGAPLEFGPGGILIDFNSLLLTWRQSTQEGAGLLQLPVLFRPQFQMN